MKEFCISKNDSDQRLNKFLEKAVPNLTAGQMHKYLRLKRIKLNGKRAEASTRLQQGDILQLYINDALLETPNLQEDYTKIAQPQVKVVYEDAHILLADKPAGMVVHADESKNPNTLIANIQALLVQRGEWNPADAQSFAPALCNRIDRNTGGIVMAAKTAEALRLLNEKIKDHELTKRYLCIVHGVPAQKSGEIDLFLRRDEKLHQVTCHKTRIAGAKTAITRYRVLRTKGELALLECELLTGRTHQIRAHLAAMGHPLLGDTKYGTLAQNKPYGAFDGQALYAYKLRFDFPTDAGVLDYLRGKEFTVQQVGFVAQYFG